MRQFYKKAPLGAFLFLACWFGTTFAAPTRIADVVDGDTVVLPDRQAVRLIGINAPEIGRDGDDDEPLAQAARERLMALTRNQAVTLIAGAEERDRHGRALAYLILPDGRDVQELLLQEGLAAPIAIPPNLRFLARYQAAAGQARRARRGIWGHGYFSPRDATLVTERGFRFVHGTVSRVQRRRYDTLLHLADHFTLVIPHADAHLFDCSLPALRGQRVIASGWVSVHKGERRLRVRHPTMLQLPGTGKGQQGNLAAACAA